MFANNHHMITANSFDCLMICYECSVKFEVSEVSWIWKQFNELYTLWTFCLYIYNFSISYKLSHKVNHHPHFRECFSCSSVKQILWHVQQSQEKVLLVPSTHISLSTPHQACCLIPWQKSEEWEVFVVLRFLTILENSHWAGGKLHIFQAVINDLFHFSSTLISPISPIHLILWWYRYSDGYKRVA